MIQETDASAALDRTFQQMARAVAQGDHSDPRELLPEALDPLEGTVPEEDRVNAQGFEWFDSAVWAKAPPGDMSQIDMTNVTPATGPGNDGNGMDWFRGTEAPNNLGNRHNQLYQARRQFAVNMASQIEEMFDVSSQGSAGYMRPWNASHAAPGGPSGNSDHYSGGAVDFFGNKEELTALRNWLIQQPFTSFVRWQSESHFDHVHASFDLGWVAQNFYEGQQLPQTTRNVARPPSPPEAARRSQPTRAAASPQGQPVQVAADPTLNKVI